MTTRRASRRDATRRRVRDADGVAFANKIARFPCGCPGAGGAVYLLLSCPVPTGPLWSDPWSREAAQLGLLKHEWPARETIPRRLPCYQRPAMFFNNVSSAVRRLLCTVSSDCSACSSAVCAVTTFR